MKKIINFFLVCVLILTSIPGTVYAATLGSYSISSPSNGGTVSWNTDVKLSWTKSSNASYYKYAVSDITTSPYIEVVKGTKTTSRSVTIDADKFEAGHKYRLYVTAYDSNDETTDNHRKNVIITIGEKPKLGNFSITEPSSGSTVSWNTDVELSWTKSSNASYYKYAVSDITSLPYVEIIKGTKTTSRSKTIDADKFEAGHKYRLYVTAYDSNDETTDNHRKNVVITIGEKPELGNFSITAPDSGSTISWNKDIELSWTKSSNASYYKYAVSDITTSPYKEIVKGTKTTSRSVTLKAGLFEAGHKYRLYVTPYDADGETKEDLRKNVKITIGDVPKPKVSGLSVPETVTMGDTFRLSGKISANGGTLQKVYINTYLITDVNTNYKLYDRDGMSISSFDLGSLGDYVVGDTIFEKPGVYKLAISAMNVGGTTGKGNVLHEAEITVKEKEPERIGAFEITSPQEGAVISADEELVITWSDAENVHHYNYAVSDKTTSPYVYIEGPARVTTGENSVTISADKLEPGHIYWIHVTAHDAAESKEAAVRNDITVTTSDSNISSTCLVTVTS